MQDKFPNKARKNLIFYDFETFQENGKHIPNLVIAKMVCIKHLNNLKIKAHINGQKSGLKYKKTTIDGVEIMYQGYELKAIYRLIGEGYNIKDLIIGKSNVPSFNYTHNGKKRYYFPDIYIPKDNRIVEVKSIYYYNRYLDKNLLKRDAVLKKGYKFDFYIMNKSDKG
jgi:hypothetical protein